MAGRRGGGRRQAAGAGPPGVRRLHRRHGQQQRHPHAHQVQLQAIRQGPQRRRPHRTLLQRPDSNGLRSFTARLERPGPGVSWHGPQRRRPPHRRQLRFWGHRLRPPHLHSRGGLADAGGAQHVCRVQGEARGGRRRRGRRGHRGRRPVPCLRRDGRHRQQLLPRPRQTSAVRHLGVRGFPCPAGLRLHQATVPARGQEGRDPGDAAGRVRAVAADPRRWARQGLRPGSQPRGAAVQLQAQGGDGAAPGGVAVPEDRLCGHLRRPAGHDHEPLQIRLRGLDERVLRHRGVRGVAPVQPGDGADVPRRPQVCLLGQLPSYRESIRDYRGPPVPKIHREPTMILLCCLPAYHRLFLVFGSSLN